MPSFTSNITFPDIGAPFQFLFTYDDSIGYAAGNTSMMDSNAIYDPGAITGKIISPVTADLAIEILAPPFSDPSGGTFYMRFKGPQRLLNDINAQLTIDNNANYQQFADRYTDATTTAITLIFTNYSTIPPLTIDGVSGYNTGTANCSIVVTQQLTPVIASNICFVAGTPVNTDDGPVAIENLGSHTIRGKKILGITRTLYSGTDLIRLDRHSIERNVPSQTTIVTPLHKIRYKHRMTCAGDIPTGVSIPYEGQLLYNVLLDHYGTMTVNGMIAETLHPNNIVARLHRTPIASQLYTAKR
jgi:hypothetical protein